MEYERELADLKVQLVKDLSGTPSPNIGKNCKSRADTRSVSSMDTLDTEPGRVTLYFIFTY